MKTAVIVNSASDAGKTGRRWKQLHRAVENRIGPVEVCFTESAGHADGLTGTLLRRGFDRIVGVGGDGTFNEIANGFIENGSPVRPGAVMALLPAGTGGDLCRSLEMPSRPDEAIEVLATGVPLEIDLGKITFEAHGGGSATRYFVNLTSLGMGGEVSARAKNAMKVLGGKAAFFWATLKVFATYRGKAVDLELDGEPSGPYNILNVAIGNGRFHGGGMYVCPDAILHDGVLNVTVIDDLSLLTLLRDSKYLYDGNIHNHPKIRCFRARRIVATSPEETRIEVDGEPLGRLPVEITVLPRAMHVLVTRNSRLLV